MELSHRVVMVFSAQVQRQTNKTASEILSSCLKFKSLPSLKLFNKPITTLRLTIMLSFEGQTKTQFEQLSRTIVHPVQKRAEVMKRLFSNYGNLR